MALPWVLVFSLDWFKIYIYIYSKPFTTSLVLEETKLMSDSFQGDPISAFTEQNDPPLSTEL